MKLFAAEGSFDLSRITRHMSLYAGTSKGFTEILYGILRRISSGSMLTPNPFSTIDKTIDKLQKIREALVGSDKNLRIANDKLQDITIKKLVKNSPTMAQKFAELKEKQQDQ